MQSTGGNDSLCRLAHDLYNKLSVILGCCELLEDVAEAGSECAKRLGTIRDAAHAMSRELQRRHCRPPEKEAIRTGPWIRSPAILGRRQRVIGYYRDLR